MGHLEGLVPLGEGREAEVFLRPDGCVLKLMRSADFADRVQREAAALEALAEADHLAPAFRDIVEVDGRPGLVSERIEGVDQLTALTRRPWLFLRAAGSMARAHTAIHRCQAPASLPNLNDVLRMRIETAPALPDHLGSHALEMLDSLPTGDRLCHGDLHPGNILGMWDAPVVIDWGDAARGDPLADVARTELLVRLGDPLHMPAGMRILTAIGRGLLARRYLALYQRSAAIDRSRLRHWEVVRAAARFYEEIEAEYKGLLAFLERQRSQ